MKRGRADIPALSAAFAVNADRALYPSPHASSTSRTAYGICIILLLGLLIPVKIQLPVSSEIIEPVRSLPLGEVWIESQKPVSSIIPTLAASNPSEPGMNGTQIVTLLWLGWLRGSSGNKFDPQPGKSEMDPPLVKVGRA